MWLRMCSELARLRSHIRTRSGDRTCLRLISSTATRKIWKFEPQEAQKQLVGGVTTTVVVARKVGSGSGFGKIEILMNTPPEPVSFLDKAHQPSFDRRTLGTMVVVLPCRGRLAVC